MNTEYTVTLKERQYEYLVEMSQKYGLPDADKALRCLITFAMSETGHEEDIFKTVRCVNC